MLTRQLRRPQLLPFLAQLRPCLIGLEACGGAHYFAREMARRGHEVKLMSPRFVRPYVKSNKNDARDAEEDYSTPLCGRALFQGSTKAVGVSSGLDDVGAVDNAIDQRLALPGIGITCVHSENARLMEWLFDFHHGALRKRAR